MAGLSSFPPGLASDPKTRTNCSPFLVSRSRAPPDTRFKCLQQMVAKRIESNATLTRPRTRPASPHRERTLIYRSKANQLFHVQLVTMMSRSIRRRLLHMINEAYPHRAVG
jgi:hypothetical protein